MITLILNIISSVYDVWIPNKALQTSSHDICISKTHNTTYLEYNSYRNWSYFKSARIPTNLETRNTKLTKHLERHKSCKLADHIRREETQRHIHQQHLDKRNNSWLHYNMQYIHTVHTCSTYMLVSIHKVHAIQAHPRGSHTSRSRQGYINFRPLGPLEV